MSNVLNKQQDMPLTAYDELLTAESTPVMQVKAHYGLLDDVLPVNLGGTTSTENSNFICSTGTGANNVSAIVTSREIQYRAGQGVRCMISALFTQGVANSAQQAGFITSESSFAFGYNGVDFGILHSRDGNLENQELTLTTGAGGSESATINIDGNPYTVPITAGTTQHNAYEIATYLDANVPGYNFTSVESVVYALAQLPDFGGGAFTFTSATAVGAWFQIKSGVLATETWINQEDWNGESVTITPTLGNVYQIQAQYLGYGGIFFWIKDPLTSRFVLVHTLHYESTDIVPSVSNPIFRIGWAARNAGNTTDIQVKGASAGAFTEGIIHYDGRPKAICYRREGVGNAKVNILAFRNRLTFNGEANRAEIIPIQASMTSDSNRTTLFEIIENPIVNGALVFERYEQNSLMEYSTSNVDLLLGGKVVACFTASNKRTVDGDLMVIMESLLPGVTYSIASSNGGGGSGIDTTLIWKEDL